MDHSHNKLLGRSSIRPSFSPLLQYVTGTLSTARLNHSYGFHTSLTLPLSATPHSAPIHQPSPSLPPAPLILSSSLLPSPLLSTSSSLHHAPFTFIQHQPSLHALSSSFSTSSSSSSSSSQLSPSIIPANDLADLESMLLWTLHEPSTIALTIIYCLSFILGFVGNLMSLRVLTNRRSQRLAGISATRSLLVNLAVCDLAVVCVCMPITLGSQIYTAWVYGDFLCRAVPFTQAVSVSASVLTLTVISVNRYYSVRSPLRARSMFTRRRIQATIAMVWTVSSVMCAPLAVMNRRHEVSFGTFAILVCQEDWPQPRLKQGYSVLLFVALYCLPVTFNLIIGFLTGRRLWGGKKSTFSDLDPRSQALHITSLKTRQKIAKMVVCLVLLFAVSWLPLYFADFWIDREERPPSWLLQTRPFAQWLGLTNSSLNPICYCFIGDLYRSARVIRTRYYQKVAALFSSSSFNDSTAVTAASTTSTSADRSHIAAAAAAAAASASVATMPRLLSLARGQGLGLRLGLQDSMDWVGGSEHSISDWYKSSPSVCGGALLPGQLHPLHSSARGADLLPTRRHSLNENIEPVDIDTLPLRRHSGDKLYSLLADRRGIFGWGRNTIFSRGHNTDNPSQVLTESAEGEDGVTHMTRL